MDGRWAMGQAAGQDAPNRTTVRLYWVFVAAYDRLCSLKLVDLYTTVLLALLQSGGGDLRYWSDQGMAETATHKHERLLTAAERRYHAATTSRAREVALKARVRHIIALRKINGGGAGDEGERQP